MQPSQVREHVLRDHLALRQQLEEIERLAKEVAGNERASVGKLRSRAEELLARLGQHMRWEDRHLLPVLEDSDAWGPERADLLTEDHRQQRTFLAGLVERLQDQRQPPVALAANLLDLTRRLRRDMEEEESVFLDPDVVRDDVVGIAVETG